MLRILVLRIIPNLQISSMIILRAFVTALSLVIGRKLLSEIKVLRINLEMIVMSMVTLKI